MQKADKYYCNNCKRKCIAHKKITLSKIPNILILHWKRFAMTQFSIHHKSTNDSAKKVTNHVEYPQYLDFRKYKDLLFEQDKDNKICQDGIYELYGVLIHSGPRLGYGHYYSLVKSPNGKWYRMNDMHVSEISLKNVLREQGYLLFYRCLTHNQYNEKIKKLNIKQPIATTTIKKKENKNENEEKEKVIIKNKTIIINDNDSKEDIKNKVINSDYFAPSCNDKNKIILVNNKIKNIPLTKQQSEENNLDRKSYVKVPPLATRPLLPKDTTNNKNNKNKKDDDAIEVFWPGNIQDDSSD